MSNSLSNSSVQNRSIKSELNPYIEVGKDNFNLIKHRLDEINKSLEGKLYYQFYREKKN